MCVWTFACYFDAERDNPNDMKASSFTEPTDIYMFSTDTHNGNLGGRSGADALCSAKRSSSYSTLPGNNVRAFISINASDEISDMPANYGVYINKPIKSHNGDIIANNWTDLLDGSITLSLSDSNISNSIWWSGSNEYGNVHSPNCEGFTTNSDVVNGTFGDATTINSMWMNSSFFSCSNPIAVLCICWD